MKRGKNLLWLTVFAVTCLSFLGKQVSRDTMCSHVQLNKNIPENFTTLSYDTNSIARSARIYILPRSHRKVNKVTIERKNSLLQWFYILPPNIVILNYTT